MQNKSFKFEPQKNATTLVVLVHGWSNRPGNLDDLKTTIEGHPQLQGADIFVHPYKTVFPFYEDPCELASQIEVDIREACNRQTAHGGNYEKIILVGHSLGALLLRKAYVYGMGSTEDRPNYAGRRSNAHEWVSKVDRIVLLAGINRGWSLEERPESVNPIAFFFMRVFAAAIRLVSFLLPFIALANYLKKLERGSPFVANLRVQWIRLAQYKNQQVASVFQLLGEKDGLVTPNDDRDLSIHSEFTFIQVPGAGHSSLIHFYNTNDNDLGQRCKDIFITTMTQDKETLKRENQERRLSAETRIERAETHIIFILHGIRDYGPWTQTIKEALESFKRDPQNHMPEYPKLKIVNPSYGYFSMLGFLFLGDRQKHVRWFMDLYTEYLSKYPHLKSKVSFIGHSNGTYILASALKNYAAMTIHHASFAGSAVRTDYDWHRVIDVEGRLGKIRNDIAASDCVIGLFPKLFEQLGQANWTDIGSAGFDGFIQAEGREYQDDKYYKGGHGAALKGENHLSIARFILTGKNVLNESLLVASDSVEPGSRPAWLSMLSKLCFIVWLVIAALLVVAIGLGVWLGQWILFHPALPSPINLVLVMLFAVVYYRTIVWVLHHI